jgi:Fe-S cluster assembly iron-binding protein IscA
MINFKSELIEKRKISNEKVDLYNSVINENLTSVKELFGLSHLYVRTQEELNGSITLQIEHYVDGEWESDDFTYDFVFKEKHCTTQKVPIENLLKNFIIDVAQRYYIKVEEIKGYIQARENENIELTKLEVFLTKDNEKEYKGNIVFKISEKYKDMQVPETFNIEAIKDDEKIYIKYCKLSELDYKTKEYKAEFDINNANLENKTEKIIF